MLLLVGAHPTGWAVSTVAASVVLALLDMIGVAAMVPLTQLISGAPADTAALSMIADVVGTSSPATLIPLIAGSVVVIFVGKSVAALFFRWWLLGRTTRISALLSAELLRRYVLAPYQSHRERSLSEIYRNVNESCIQASSTLLAVVTLCTDVLMLLAITVVLSLTSPVVTILAIVVLGGSLLGMQRLLRRRQTHVGEEFAEAGLTAWQYLTPTIDGFREVRLSSSAGSFVGGFLEARLRGARAARVNGILSDIPRYTLEIGFVAAIGGVSLLLFATGTPSQALTVLGVFAAASIRALPTLTRVAANLAVTRTGRVGLEIALSAARDLDENRTHQERSAAVATYDGDIEIRDLSFSYPDSDAPVLDGLTFSIPQGQTTAFVGSSGAGKSTLLDLVLGLLRPSQGTIECGGRPILDDLSGWYAGLGVVPQDVFLMNASIASNIAFGASADAIDRTRLREVVALAQLEDLIEELPHGLDTLVGERGVRLSGGQRQRLGLARALYPRPRVLVLDEATSALDNSTEHEIADTLTHLKGQMTIIIVAHRLSTVRDADRLLFLHAGRIDAQGTFGEVRRASAEFARLVELGTLGD